MLIKIHEEWHIPENRVAPEAVYLNRRRFIKKIGQAGLGIAGIASGLAAIPASAQVKYDPEVRRTIPVPDGIYPAPRNAKYTVDRPLTPEEIAASYNNFYEFTLQKNRVWRLAEKFTTHPWEIEITGHVHKKLKIDIDDLLKQLPIEERIYRHRCVEAWSMVVPWSGIPFKRFLEFAQPTSKARYVRMVSFMRPKEAPGQRERWYPWPYYEGLSLDEAANELAFLATGVYGHALPNQHGAPMRLVIPWKYGFKSIKSIVKFEFVDKQPPTFWNDLAANEYSFQANVDPAVPHPRWSQATERDIGTGKRLPTQLYNGYEEFVAPLYG